MKLKEADSHTVLRGSEQKTSGRPKTADFLARLRHRVQAPPGRSVWKGGTVSMSP